MLALFLMFNEGRIIIEQLNTIRLIEKSKEESAI